MDDLEARVVEILAAQALIDPASVRLEDDPAEIGLDSLGMVEAIFAIEEAFGIAVPFNANEPGVGVRYFDRGRGGGECGGWWPQRRDAAGRRHRRGHGQCAGP